MKDWTNPEIQELNIKNTEVNSMTGTVVDGGVYDKDNNFIRDAYS